jgi:hypothetical protein
LSEWFGCNVFWDAVYKPLDKSDFLALVYLTIAVGVFLTQLDEQISEPLIVGFALSRPDSGRMIDVSGFVKQTVTSETVVEFPAFDTTTAGIINILLSV